MPKTLKEYEIRSRNWLNGRRAPNYAKTLFPEMIQYVKKVLCDFFLFSYYFVFFFSVLLLFLSLSGCVQSFFWDQFLFFCRFVFGFYFDLFF